MKTALTYILILLSLFGITSVKIEHSTVIREDLKKFYDQYKVEGSFILYDQKNDKYIIYNQKQTSTEFSPASTFKICNSLIANETGVIAYENVVLKWDGKDRRVLAWNADTDMKNAFRNSTIGYYQELARRIG